MKQDRVGGCAICLGVDQRRARVPDRVASARGQHPSEILSISFALRLLCRPASRPLLPRGHLTPFRTAAKAPRIQE